MSHSFAIDPNLHLLRHPFYQAWMEGRLTREALREYARQYHHHVEAFPRYLENACTLFAEGEEREILQDNLAEENGEKFGTSHPELWLQFAEGLAVSREDVLGAEPRPAVRNVVATFNTLTRTSQASALGALFAYESQVPEIAQSKIEGLKRHFALTDERALAFFEVHRTADVEHRERLLEIIDAWSPEQKDEARAAADQACRALWDFLTDIYAPSDEACA